MQLSTSRFIPASATQQTQELTLNPDYWGPRFWDVLHLAAVGFSAEPTPSEKLGFRMFFDSLRYVLPCPKCRASYETHLDTRGLLDADLLSRDTLFRWVFDLHNIVNITLNKPQVNFIEYQDRYYPKSITAPDVVQKVSTVALSLPSLNRGVRSSVRTPYTPPATRTVFSQLATQALSRLQILSQPQPRPRQPQPRQPQPQQPQPQQPQPQQLQPQQPQPQTFGVKSAQPVTGRFPSLVQNNFKSKSIVQQAMARPGAKRTAAMYSSGCGCRRR
jgi:hypothetical protein